MDIFENCQDPYNNLFEDSDQFPTNPYYPPGKRILHENKIYHTVNSL